MCRYRMSDVLFVCSYLEVQRRYQDYEKITEYISNQVANLIQKIPG
jgi:hypothetical protein